MKSNGKYVKSIWFMTAVFAAIVIFIFVFGMLDFFKGGRKEQITYDCSRLVGWSLVKEDGTKSEIALPCEFNVEPGETVAIEAYLPKKIHNDVWIDILADDDFNVYIDGKERFKFDRNKDTIIGGSVKETHYFVELFAEDSGKIVRIEKRGSISNGFFPNIYIGSSLGLIERTIRKNLVFFIGDVSLILIATITIIIGFYQNRKQGSNFMIVSVGLGVLIDGLWLVFDSELFQFAFRNYYIDGVISYMLLMIVSIPFMYYFNFVQGERYKRIYIIVASVLEMEFVVLTVLHFTGVANYLVTFPVMAAVEGAEMIVAIILFVRDLIKGYTGSYRISLIGIMGYILSGVGELIMTLISDKWIDGSLMLAGLYWLLSFAIVHQLTIIREAQDATAVAMLASEAKSNFLANMSHEIRTPMNSIIGMDEMIIREAEDDERIIRYAMNIKNAGNILLSIINDILDLSKIESGKAELICAQYDLSSAINDIINITYKRASDKGLDFLVDVSPGLPRTLYGDEVRVRQIIMNIVNNAIKYTNEGSVSLRVSFSPMEKDDYINLSVSVVDTGIGIKKDEMNKLFTSFGRLEESRNRNIEGTGLGLNITRKYLDMMEGTITVDSEYGVGSTFTATIPQKVVDYTNIGNFSDAVKKIMPLDEYCTSLMAPGANILVVDDNEMNLEVISGLLEVTKIKTDLAASGAECLSKLSRRSYDLIFLDQMMPEMDGVHTLAAIREQFPNVKCPIVVLTADAISGAREYYIKQGFTDYLSKPVKSFQLEAVLLKYLPSNLILSKDEADRIMYAERKKRKNENKEALPKVIVINPDSEELKREKEFVDKAFDGTFVRDISNARKYLEKHEAEYVLVKASDYFDKAEE